MNESPLRAVHPGDFALRPRTLLITAVALVIGGASAVVAFCLPRLIVLAPVAAGRVIGLMARYGSEKIRGHGMPETIDAIVPVCAAVAVAAACRWSLLGTATLFPVSAAVRPGAAAVALILVPASAAGSSSAPAAWSSRALGVGYDVIGTLLAGRAGCR